MTNLASPRKLKLRDYLNADIFLSSVTGNILCFIPVAIVLYMPTALYGIFMEGSFMLLFLLVGFGLGAFVQHYNQVPSKGYDMVKKTAQLELSKLQGKTIDLSGEFPGPNFKNTHAASVFNEIVQSLWPDVAKNLEATFETAPDEPMEVSKDYSLHLKQLGLLSLALKFKSVQSLRPEYLDDSHAMVMGTFCLSGEPNTEIHLHSNKTLCPDVDAKIKKLTLTGNLYCRVDCVYWKIWVWFDKDLKVDVKL